MNLFNQLIDSNSNFIITTHINPDGDAIGSAVALYQYLNELGKNVKIINYSSTPKYYSFLDPESEIIQFNENCKSLIKNAEIIFILDLNEISRVKSMGEYILSSTAKKVIIDHHIPNKKFADYEFTDTKATSTGEILYRLLSENGKRKLSKKISVPLYAAIMTDTQSFHLPTVTAETYRIAANLIDWGADPNEIYRDVYQKNDLNRFRLLGQVLSSIKIHCDGKLLYMKVTQDIFEETKTEEQDIDNFIDYGMMIKDVLIVIFFVELKDGVKISFRSRGDISINELAREYGGNGHKNAAGARLFKMNLDQIMPDVLQKAENFLPG